MIEQLTSIPRGRWGSIQSQNGRIDVYHCDAEDNDAYIIEMGGNPRVRLSLKKAINYINTLANE